MAAKIIAQIAMTGASIVSKAFVAAYSQAVQNAAKGTVQSAKAMTRRSKMSTEESLNILELTKADIDPVKINAKYEKYFQANDPDKGGSFYLQSKVFRAKESLEELMRIRALAEAEALAKTAKEKEAGESQPGAQSQIPSDGEQKSGPTKSDGTR